MLGGLFCQVGDDGDTSNYIPNSEWTLVQLHAERHVRYYSCCSEPYPDITYTIQARLLHYTTMLIVGIHIAYWRESRCVTRPLSLSSMLIRRSRALQHAQVRVAVWIA